MHWLGYFGQNRISVHHTLISYILVFTQNFHILSIFSLERQQVCQRTIITIFLNSSERIYRHWEWKIHIFQLWVGFLTPTPHTNDQSSLKTFSSESFQTTRCVQVDMNANNLFEFVELLLPVCTACLFRSFLILYRPKVAQSSDTLGDLLLIQEWWGATEGASSFANYRRLWLRPGTESKMFLCFGPFSGFSYIFLVRVYFRYQASV